MKACSFCSVWAALGGFAFAVLALCSCSEQLNTQSSPGSNVVAQVDGRSITLEEVTAALSRRSQPPTPEFKRLALEELIRSEVLLQAARRVGYHQKRELMARFDQLVAAEYRDQMLQPLLQAAENISENELRAYYETHVTDYTSPAAVRARVIFLNCRRKATRDKRAEAAQRAEELHHAAEQVDEAGFADLVREHSEDQASRYTGGDTGWLVQQPENSRWPAQVSVAALALSKPGEVAPVVETETGFFIVQLREKRTVTRRPLAEVAPGIRYLLVKEKQREAEHRFYEQLESGVQIQIHGPVLDSIPGPSNKAAAKPPVLPGG